MAVAVDVSHNNSDANKRFSLSTPESVNVRGAYQHANAGVL